MKLLCKVNPAGPGSYGYLARKKQRPPPRATIWSYCRVLGGRSLLQSRYPCTSRALLCEVDPHGACHEGLQYMTRAITSCHTGTWAKRSMSAPSREKQVPPPTSCSSGLVR